MSTQPKLRITQSGSPTVVVSGPVTITYTEYVTVEWDGGDRYLSAHYDGPIFIEALNVSSNDDE